MIRAQQITHLSLMQKISREIRNKYYLQTSTALFKALSSVKRICRNVQRRAAISYIYFYRRVQLTKLYQNHHKDPTL